MRKNKKKVLNGLLIAMSCLLATGLVLQVTNVLDFTSLFEEEVETNSNKKVGTAVPNSGTINKIYFNTNLSNDEIIGIIDSLTFSWSDTNYTKMYMVVSNGHIHGQSLMIGKQRSNINDEFIYFIILNDNSSDGSVGTNCWNNNDGWLLNNIAFSGNLVGEYENIPIGNQNNILKDLISITPFE